MRSFARSFARRRWPLLTLTGVALGGASVGVLRLQSLAQELLPGYLKGQLEAALGRPVEFGQVRLWPTGLWVEQFRIPRLAGEAADPVSAKGVRVSADWWSLISKRQVRIDEVVLDGAQLRLATSAALAGKGPWTGQVLQLAGTGIRRFGVQDASIQFLSDAKGSVAWSAADIDGTVKLQPDTFEYQARVDRFQAPGVMLAGVDLAGSGNAKQLLLSRASVAYEGGRLNADGNIRVADNRTDLRIRVDQMPLDRLASRIGIPNEWAMKGTVTGVLTVDARDNALRSIRGTVDVARGSFSRPGGQFPWETARAKVEWTPEQATLSDVKVTGDGLTLTAAGVVRTPAGTPFTEGAFDLTGRVVAARNGSVSRVAELLAFRRVLEGRWEAGSATVDFKANGLVGQVAAARATGKLQVEDLRFRPVADQEAATVDHLSADLERSPEKLALRNVQARTDGFTAVADVTLTDDRPKHAAEFRVDGSVEVKDLKSLRRTLPQAALWRWIPVASPRASGKLAFRMGGQVASPADLWADGKFEARDFRLSAASSLPSGAVFFIPVDVAKGTFRHAGRQFEIRDLNLDARTFDASGRLALDFRKDPTFQTALRVETDDWRSLPAMPPNAIPELNGGHLVAHLKLDSPLAQLTAAPVEGGFRLVNATYTPGREGATPLPVQEFGAQFRWVGRVLHLPQVTVATPLVSGSAEGRIYPATNRDYHLALDVKASSPAASELVERFTSDVRLAGGRADAHFQLDAPVQELTQAALSGTLDLKEAKVAYPVEALGIHELDARSLSVDFSRGPQGWQLARLALEAPGLTASLSGVVATDRVDADVSVQMDRWTAPEKLPVTGGRFKILGRVTGETAKPETVAFSGDVSLQDAALRVSASDYALEGGKLSLAGGLKVALSKPEDLNFAGELKVDGARARFTQGKLALNEGLVSLQATGAGSLVDPAKWVRTGSVQLAGGQVVNDGQAFPKVEKLAAFFTRDGDRIRWNEAKLAVAGSTLESRGWWSPEGHELDLTAQVDDLAPFGVKLPAGVEAGKSGLTVHVTGTRQKPVATARGRVELGQVKLAVAGAPAQPFDRVTGGFHLENEALRLEELRGEGPAGTVTARGLWGADAQEFTVLVEGSDFSKLGMELPEGFRVQGFRLAGQLAGNAQKPLNRIDGTIRLTRVQFPFGPAGPHKLETVEAKLAGTDGQLKLTDLVAAGPAGRFTGTGEISPKGYQIALMVPSMNPDVVRWLLPGQVQGGTLSGTLTLAGDHQEPVRSADGRFELLNAKYVAPEALQLASTATAVSRFSGEYRWDKRRTQLDKLRVESPLLSADGSLSYVDNQGQLKADLKTANLGQVAGYWPALAGLMAGGSSTGHLEARFEGESVRGTLALENRGGVLHLPGMTGEFAEHPVDTAGVVLGFEPGKLTFRDVKVRGAKGNADGEGTWSPNGAVFGTGKAWFSKSYTSKLMPKGVGWLAKLFGLKEIKSDFKIEGDAEQVHLNAGITRSFLWKFAKGSVPKEFQEIARGKAPLWVKPLETVEQPPTAETPVPKLEASRPAASGG